MHAYRFSDFSLESQVSDLADRTADTPDTVIYLKPVGRAILPQGGERSCRYWILGCKSYALHVALTYRADASR